MMKHLKSIVIASMCLVLTGALALAQAKPKNQNLRVKGIKTVIAKMDAASKDKTRAVGEAFEVEEPDMSENAQLEKSKARMCFYCGTVMMEVMGKSIYNPVQADDPRTKKKVTAYFKRLKKMLRSVGIGEETQTDLDVVITAYQANSIEDLGAALEKLSGTIQDNLEEKLGPDAIWYYSLGYSAKGYKLAGQAKLYDMVSVIAPTPEDLLSYTPEKVDARIKTALTELSPVSQKNEDEIGPRDYALLKTRSTVILNSFRKGRAK